MEQEGIKHDFSSGWKTKCFKPTLKVCCTRASDETCRQKTVERENKWQFPGARRDFNKLVVLSEQHVQNKNIRFPISRDKRCKFSQSHKIEPGNIWLFSPPQTWLRIITQSKQYLYSSVELFNLPKLLVPLQSVCTCLFLFYSILYNSGAVNYGSKTI